MPPLKNDRLLKALKLEPVDVTPVWIMRQAGRYLPEYKAVRAEAKSFMNLCKTPELACKVTLQPLARFPLDAAIIFSDILTIPDAMGLGLTFVEGEGPIFTKAFSIEELRIPDETHLNYVYEAIKLVKKALDNSIPLIGFCGSPWTLAAYMVQGRSVPGFPAIQRMRAENSSLLHKLLNVLAKSVENHLAAQIKAGADVVMIFDTWGGLLKGSDYHDFSLQYMQQIIKGLASTYNKDIPIILFTKNGNSFLEGMAASGCHAIGLDWEITLHEARKRIGANVAIQGNLDPAHLRATPSILRKEISEVLASFGHGPGHIFNLGHGITPDIDPDQVALLVETVHELSKPYHL